MLIWLTRIAGALALIFTLLPLIRTGNWFIRGWDFPRMQLAFVLAVLAAGSIIIALRQTNRTEFMIWTVALALGLLWQASHIIVFTPIWSPEVSTTEDTASTHAIVTVNLEFTNSRYQQVGTEIQEANPEILILVEFNHDWSDGLSDLADSFPYQHNEIRDDGTGIAIWSKLKIESAKTEFVVEENRPSVWAKVEMNNQLVNLVAVHPTPPGLPASHGESRRDSRTRDAELITIAKTIANSPDQSWIVAGDFNDVAWSHTTRMFKRISGLKDPRVGRSYIGTYHSEYPLCRFPIDHVFLSDGFSIQSLSRHFITGSDHFAVSAVVSPAPLTSGVRPEPEGDDLSDADELIEEGQRDADQRGISTDPTKGQVVK